MTRAAWLATLTPDDLVILHTVTGPYPATISRIDERPDRTGQHRVWLMALKPNSSLPDWATWVWRETGDCPGARLWIEPRPEPDAEPA